MSLGAIWHNTVDMFPQRAYYIRSIRNRSKQWLLRSNHTQ